jgi:hypothetical protein
MMKISKIVRVDIDLLGLVDQPKMSPKYSLVLVMEHRLPCEPTEDLVKTSICVIVDFNRDYICWSDSHFILCGYKILTIKTRKTIDISYKAY